MKKMILYAKKSGYCYFKKIPENKYIHISRSVKLYDEENNNQTATLPSNKININDVIFTILSAVGTSYFREMIFSRNCPPSRDFIGSIFTKMSR